MKDIFLENTEMCSNLRTFHRIPSSLFGSVPKSSCLSQLSRSRNMSVKHTTSKTVRGLNETTFSLEPSHLVESHAV